MEHLKKFSKVIYINTPLEIIMERIDIDQKRGLAVPEGMSIPEIYSEREPMYPVSYTHLTLPTNREV